MHRFPVRVFCLQLAFLLLAVGLSVYAVVGTVGASLHLSFVETAERTDLVLSLLSGLMVVAISLFAAYAAHRHRKNQAP